MSHFILAEVSKDNVFKQTNYKAITENTCEIHQISNNKLPLTTVYNKQIDTALKVNCDFLILKHADVNLNLDHLLKHVEECKNKYDVFGLCGTSTLNISQSPLNWYTSSNPTPITRWGCVIHGELENQQSYFSSHSPTVLDHEVACIDGLCIILSKKAIESGLRFDEQFEYDCYDTDISLQAILKYNLKVGCLVEMDLYHYSIGKSILSDNFLKSELKLRKKWNFDVPKNSKLEQIINSTVSQ